MQGKFNYAFRHGYPQLIGEGTEVWSRFIIKFPDRFDTVDYGVKVGRGADSSALSDETSRQYWSMFTKKCIDVIGYKNDCYHR